MHRIYLDGLVGLSAAGSITVSGAEARHAARVKRVAPGEVVEVLDGHGGVATGRVAEVSRARAGSWELRVEVDAARRAEPYRPRLEVWSATPKGRRVEEMIDGLSQVGAAAWRALETARGVVDPRTSKVERLARVAIEASKQSGRAWVMEVGAKATISEAEALARSADVSTVVADAEGAPYTRSNAPRIVLLVGPEGGWTKEELGRLRAAGAKTASFGPHVMRIETAAVVGAAVVMAQEHAS